jgi:hypothetical protein
MLEVLDFTVCSSLPTPQLISLNFLTSLLQTCLQLPLHHLTTIKLELSHPKAELEHFLENILVSVFSLSQKHPSLREITLNGISTSLIYKNIQHYDTFTNVVVLKLV